MSYLSIEIIPLKGDTTWCNWYIHNTSENGFYVMASGTEDDMFQAFKAAKAKYNELREW